METLVKVIQGPYRCNCIICPSCKAHELINCNNPNPDQWRWQIRPYKVDNWSHCLVCNTWFDENGKVEPSPVRRIPKDSRVVFEQARQKVRRVVGGELLSPSTLLEIFIFTCRELGLPMKMWEKEWTTPEEDELLAKGYELL